MPLEFLFLSFFSLYFQYFINNIFKQKKTWIKMKYFRFSLKGSARIKLTLDNCWFNVRLIFKAYHTGIVWSISSMDEWKKMCSKTKQNKWRPKINCRAKHIYVYRKLIEIFWYAVKAMLMLLQDCMAELRSNCVILIKQEKNNKKKE